MPSLSSALPESSSTSEPGSEPGSEHSGPEAFEDVDLLDLDFHMDAPDAFYRWLVDERPLYYDRQNALWAVSRYEDVVSVSTNTELFCSRYGVVPGITLEDWPDEAMINKDGHDHTVQRRLVSKGFTPRNIARWESRCVEFTRQLLDRIGDAEAFDLVGALARPLPMMMIGEMLGYPPERNMEVLDHCDVYTHAGSGGEHITEEVVDAFSHFCVFHEELLEEKRERRGEDLLSIWLDAEVDGRKLAEDTLLFEHNLILVGGSETTRNAIAVGLLELLRHRDQWAALCADPSLIPNAVEEMIRWSTPFVRMKRTLTRDHEWYGQQLRAMDQIAMIYPAANRDPRVFERPLEFDIRRSFARPSLSFGFGKHYCLGAALARLELRTVMEGLVSRMPDLRLDPEQAPESKRSSFIRALTRLPVRQDRA